MTKYKKEERTYTPADICKQFDLPRTTLFRWEENKEILAPDRNEKGERIYGQKHLKSLCERLRRKIEEEVETLYQNHEDNEFNPSKLEPLYKLEMATSKNLKHDLQNLRGLARTNGLSEATMDYLYSLARERPREDEIRKQIFGVMSANG